jgi:hypothetical protein
MYNTARNPTNPLDPGNPWPFDRTPRSFTHDTRLGYGARPMVNWPNTGAFPNPIPRLVKLKNKAILADLVCFPQSLEVRHKKGINVLYGNGGAKWVDRKALEKVASWRAIPYDSFTSGYNNLFLSQHPLTGAETGFGIWAEMDKQ